MSSDRNKIYFASDFHLGVPSREKSRAREDKIVDWLNFVEKDASDIFLVGDIFDFWFEYKNAVPKGYVRLLGKLAQLSDKGIKLHLFRGNHDMWIFDYVPSEIGATLHEKPKEFEFNGVKLFVGHGDGLGPGDRGYKILKSIFANKICQWLFERIHPNLGIGIANFWSGRSRMSNDIKEDGYLGDDKEFLTIFCNDYIKNNSIDYFIFGHRHLPLDVTLSNGKSKYINLGEWVNEPHYAVLADQKLELKKWE